VIGRVDEESGRGFLGILIGTIEGNTLTHFPYVFFIYPGAHLHNFVPGIYP
jgi:hypothetical protein